MQAPKLRNRAYTEARQDHRAFRSSASPVAHSLAHFPGHIPFVPPSSASPVAVTHGFSPNLRAWTTRPTRLFSIPALRESPGAPTWLQAPLTRSTRLSCVQGLPFNSFIAPAIYGNRHYPFALLVGCSPPQTISGSTQLTSSCHRGASPGHRLVASRALPHVTITQRLRGLNIGRASRMVSFASLGPYG